MRIFLSHSSKDKESYCNAVANYLIEKLGKNSIVYDAVTFEAGEKSFDEINRTLAISDLYVILLSDNAVESKWVKYELKEAHKKFNDRALNRIYPLIIDSSLKFSDERIPKWLKDYNLKYIARPTKAAKLIIERAKDTNWSRHPGFQSRNTIFVGRNELIDDFEIRIDDFDQPPLNTFIVSGLPNIGRKSLVRQCFIKGTIIPQYYEFSTISLSYQESIEDFIIKISDLGFTDGKEIEWLPSKSFEQKLKCAINLSKKLSDLSEIVLIKDDGCLVDYRGNVTDWFKQIVSTKTLCEKIIFVIITKYKTNYESMRLMPSSAYINVPELNHQERRGLLRRLAEVNHLTLTRQQLETICKHLTGYPAQVHYAIEIIKYSGYAYLARNIKLLSDFNQQEVSLLLKKYEENSKELQILALIARYDAISVTMLYDILSITPEYITSYEALFQESLFELEGVNREYVRLNEVVRNYVLRSGFKICPIHRKKAQEIFEQMFSDDASTWYNSNDFLLAIRENVSQGKTVASKDIIPSVYLKSMSDLYANMKYDDVVKLARRAFENSENTDQKILYEIRYLLCTALAKLKHTDFLNEVHKLDYDDNRFLSAFYYRQIGKNDRALEYLNDLLRKRPEMSKAKREKVLVLKNLQQYAEALGLAKENYYLYSDNPYHIQAYFDCLINTYQVKPEDDLLEELLERLSVIKSEKAQSMYSRCQALFTAYVEKDYLTSLNQIEQSVIDFPVDKKYALTVKFQIARVFRDFDEMEKTVHLLEGEGANNNTIVICRSKLLAQQNKFDEAIDYFTKHILFFTEESKLAFCEKLKKHELD